MSVKSKKTESNSDFKEALIKKALGYDVKEIIEEYVEGDNGEIKLTKKKVTIKNVPPDVTAIKYLLDDSDISLDKLTDEELEEEKNRLLSLIRYEDEKENKSCKKISKKKKTSM